MDAQLHDFTKPTRLPTDWQYRLSAWCKVALGLASKAWAKELPVPLEASVERLDVDYAQVALSRLAEGSLGYRVKIGGDKLATLLVMPRTLVVSIVGALLGDAQTSETAARELTPVEENLADYFLADHWLKYFRESWPATALPWMLEARDANPQCSRLFTSADTLVTLHWRIQGPWGATPGVWFFPKRSLIEALGVVDASIPPAIPEAQVAARRQAIVSSLPITLEIVLGDAELKLSQLSRLQVGDVVLLDRRTDEGATARAGGVDLFHGQLGRVGSWKALRIDAAQER